MINSLTFTLHRVETLHELQDQITSIAERFFGEGAAWYFEWSAKPPEIGLAYQIAEVPPRAGWQADVTVYLEAEDE